MAVKFSADPAHTGELLPAVSVHVAQDAGAVYVFVSVQVASAEKAAVRLQAAPLEVRLGNVYVIGLVHGDGMVTLPPQLLLTVSVPLDGGYWNVICPVTE